MCYAVYNVIYNTDFQQLQRQIDLSDSLGNGVEVAAPFSTL